MKYLSLIILLFFSLKLFASSKSNNEEWYELVKKYYFDYEVGLNEYKNKNYDKAFKILYTLAKLGDARAQSDIAGMYFNGWGVKTDHKKAFFGIRQLRKMEILTLNTS